MTIAIIIIVILSLAVVFLLWVLRVVLRQNEKYKFEIVDDYSYDDMIRFAQFVTNHEVTDLDLREWVSKKELEQLRFSDN